MKNEIKSYSLIQKFNENLENDFFVHILGYDNFEGIEPLKIPHKQEIYTLHFIFNGSGKLIIKNKEFYLKKHDIFFLPAGIDMCYYPNENDKWSYAWFSFTGNVSDKYADLMKLSIDNPKKPCNRADEIHNDLIEIFKRMENKERINYYEILGLFYKITGVNSERKEVRSQGISDTVITYINNHYHDSDLKIEDICAAVGVSHTHLCRTFREHSGMSVKQYLVKTRISEAARLLKITYLSIQEIAFTVGFSDNMHFSKCFKKYTGMSARDYRKQARE